jgi:hypothetical protein
MYLRQLAGDVRVSAYSRIYHAFGHTRFYFIVPRRPLDIEAWTYFMDPMTQMLRDSRVQVYPWRY